MNVRRKGIGYEREVAARYRERGFDAERGRQGTRGGRELTPDVQVSGLPYWIECKRMARIAVCQIYERAKKEAGSKEPVLHIKQDRGEPLVVISEDTWFELLDQHWRGP